jgi:hypothetical protein
MFKMNLTKLKITVYDPLNRNMDLMSELNPYFVSGGQTWENCATTGTYIKCGKYFVMNRMKNLGLKCIEDPFEGDNKDIDVLELMLYCGIAINNGYVFPKHELDEIKNLTESSRLQLAPRLPNTHQFDKIRDQFNFVRNSLELFKIT